MDGKWIVKDRGAKTRISSSVHVIRYGVKGLAAKTLTRLFDAAARGKGRVLSKDSLRLVGDG